MQPSHYLAWKQVFVDEASLDQKQIPPVLVREEVAQITVNTEFQTGCALQKAEV